MSTIKLPSELTYLECLANRLFKIDPNEEQVRCHKLCMDFLSEYYEGQTINEVEKQIESSQEKLQDFLESQIGEGQSNDDFYDYSFDELDESLCKKFKYDLQLVAYELICSELFLDAEEIADKILKLNTKKTIEPASLVLFKAASEQATKDFADQQARVAYSFCLLGNNPSQGHLKILFQNRLKNGEWSKLKDQKADVFRAWSTEDTEIGNVVGYEPQPPGSLGLQNEFYLNNEQIKTIAPIIMSCDRCYIPGDDELRIRQFIDDVMMNENLKPAGPKEKVVNEFTEKKQQLRKNEEGFRNSEEGIKLCSENDMTWNQLLTADGESTLADDLESRQRIVYRILVDQDFASTCRIHVLYQKKKRNGDWGKPNDDQRYYKDSANEQDLVIFDLLNFEPSWGPFAQSVYFKVDGVDFCQLIHQLILSGRCFTSKEYATFVLSFIDGFNVPVKIKALDEHEQ